MQISERIKILSLIYFFKIIKIYFIEVIILSIKIKENYSKDGKNLFELVQEWINENILLLDYISKQKNVKYKYR